MVCGTTRQQITETEIDEDLYIAIIRHRYWEESWSIYLGSRAADSNNNFMGDAFNLSMAFSYPAQNTWMQILWIKVKIKYKLRFRSTSSFLYYIC